MLVHLKYVIGFCTQLISGETLIEIRSSLYCDSVNGEMEKGEGGKDRDRERGKKELYCDFG